MTAWFYNHVTVYLTNRARDLIFLTQFVLVTSLGTMSWTIKPLISYITRHVITAAEPSAIIRSWTATRSNWYSSIVYVSCRIILYFMAFDSCRVIYRENCVWLQDSKCHTVHILTHGHGLVSLFCFYTEAFMDVQEQSSLSFRIISFLVNW